MPADSNPKLLVSASFPKFLQTSGIHVLVMLRADISIIRITELS